MPIQKITSTDITNISNTSISGTITGSQISANTVTSTNLQTGSVENYMSSQGLALGMRNKIINGAMMIDQRNAGAAVTNNATVTQYSLDRWSITTSVSAKFTAQQSSDAPTGFLNSLLITSLSAYSVLVGDYFEVTQRIEGLNCSDLAFGSVSAKTVTLSFWVKSSLTGTFGGVLQNAAGNRSYPYTYTISAANTWEQKSITVAGDTTGTWVTTNGVGLRVIFGLGVGSTYSGTSGSWAAAGYESATGATSVVGTNGATFYITGVQLEKGATATPFENRLFTTELQLCQRYYQTSYPLGVAVQSYTNATDGANFIAINSSDTGNGGPLPVSMRATPTFYTYSSNGSVGANSARKGADGTNVTGITLIGGTTNNLPRLSGGAFYTGVGNVFNAQWVAIAEL
jgi:hypothetical protein